MAYRRGLGGLIAVLLGLAAVADPTMSWAEPWTFGDFHIDWPDGFVHQDTPGVDQFVRDDGIGVTVDVEGHGPLPKPKEREAVGHWQAYARTEMTALASRNGQIVIPLKDETLASGLELLSLSAERSSEAGKSFGIFFLLVSPDGKMAQIIVEGPGFAAQGLRAFRPALDTARWKPAP